jgi:hypothetical protein
MLHHHYLILMLQHNNAKTVVSLLNINAFVVVQFIHSLVIK